MKKIKYIFLAIVTAALASCIYPYEVDFKEGSGGTVVIEGDILCGEISKFKVALSRSVSDTVMDKFFVLDLYVEGEDGKRYQGVQSGDVYEVDTRNLDLGGKYRFVSSISRDVNSLSYAKTYQTEFMQVMVTPAIDSIFHKVADDKKSASIHVTSHDDNTPVGYYKWNYEENWEIRSSYVADLEYEYYSNSVREIDQRSENRYYCWGKNISESINVHSTENTGSNIASDIKLQTIDCTDKRACALYCIDVYQYAITKEGYNFWNTMKKNEEDLGTIFSPQPSSPRGNIICQEDPEQYVIGYIGCSTVTSKRKFIYAKDMDIYQDNPCPSHIYGREEWQSAYMSRMDVITFVEGPGGGYLWAPVECVDCRIYGTKEKPSFWPNNNQ